MMGWNYLRVSLLAVLFGAIALVFIRIMIIQPDRPSPTEELSFHLSSILDIDSISIH
ncbi:MAG: hypothetical protein HC769_16690 [Cyanobacteria bacterium CRU_2_1]|nr:hypothetical protein [Cyanobacteria bacterium RU_5_0]NJR60317.1 hypothetical protein [Cyanobacteria bacterium CRU_2_1]